MSDSRFACVLALTLGLPLAQAGPQMVPVVTLSELDGASEHGFTKLVGVKELRDGRVILVDQIEQLILRLDPTLTEGIPIGNTGEGPGEYRVPSRLFPLVGDSSAVLDSPNRRLLILGPDGEPGGVVRFLPVAGSFKLRASGGRGGGLLCLGDRDSPLGSGLFNPRYCGRVPGCECPHGGKAALKPGG